MISRDNIFIVTKLASGEQVIAVLRSEDEDYVVVEYPMNVKLTPSLNPNTENIVASPLCFFSKDDSYVLNKKHLVYIKKLDPEYIDNYIKIVDQFDIQTGLEEDSFEDEDYTALETLQEKLDFIESLMKVNEQVTEEDSPDKKFFMKGNETIN